MIHFMTVLYKLFTNLSTDAVGNLINSLLVAGLGGILGRFLFPRWLSGFPVSLS